jgi:hypothetical protein
MCIIVDINTFASVFNKSSMHHAEFSPVMDWVLYGNGTLIYGGTKYFKEIANTKYLPLFLELNKKQKAKNIDRSKVDEKEFWAAGKVKDRDFDDQHLVALLLVSGCKLICSLDKRAYPYFRHHLFFSPAWRKPKIYSRKENAHLLTDKNIAEVCKPGSKLTVSQIEELLPNIQK